MCKIKCICTGAQGTGKTTILNHFKGSFLTLITEVARDFQKQGIKINEEGDDNTQKLIFDKYWELLNQDINYISDRGLTDVIAYTAHLCDIGQIKDKSILDYQLDKLEEFIKNNPDIITFYFPIEFDLVDDGVRSMDNTFRSSIDNKIRLLVESYCKNFIIISGTVEQRINTIISKIDDELINNAPPTTKYMEWKETLKF